VVGSPRPAARGSGVKSADSRRRRDRDPFASRPEPVFVALMKNRCPWPHEIPYRAGRSRRSGRRHQHVLLATFEVTTRCVKPPCDCDAATSPLVIVLFTARREVEKAGPCLIAVRHAEPSMRAREARRSGSYPRVVAVNVAQRGREDTTPARPACRRILVAVPM